jgi:predicted PolB exonuclease-like 3'-5' exonuclease
MDGSQVWDAYLKGQLPEIRNYCETDVLNTYLVYLRFEQMRGRLSPEQVKTEMTRIKETLRRENKPHFDEFLNAWRN